MKKVQILHETEIPYVIADKKSNTLKIMLHIIEDAVRSASILYGDIYDYQDDRNYGWNYRKSVMNLRYHAGNRQTWDVEIEVPKWKRIKYIFLVTAENGIQYLYNEYGLRVYDQAAKEQIQNTYHCHFFYPYICDEDLIQYPEWVKDTVWYQIFPDRFARGQERREAWMCSWEEEHPGKDSCYGGDLCGIIRKLDYLEELGVTGIYLTPIFEASSIHKYDTKNYFKIDSQFGTEEQLKELVDKAHAKNMHVILDGVFNHIGYEHPFWQDVLEKQELSEYQDFFCIREFPVDSSVLYSKNLNYDTFSFVATMPKLNYESPRVKEYILSVMEYWIRVCGIDGWRLDVGNEIPFSFYAEMKKRLKPIKDDIYIIAEIWHDANRWFRNGYIDATMNYSLCSSILDYTIYQSINSETFNRRFFHLLGRLSAVHSSLSFNLLDSHDTERVMTMAGEDSVRVKNAFLMMFLFPGSPCVYYGTEIGMRGGKDPDNRRPMIWDEEKWDKELLEFFRNLIRLRRENSRWIQNANVEFVHEDGCNVWRFFDEEMEWVLQHNISGKERKISAENPMISTVGDGQILKPNGMLLYRK